MWGCFRYKRRLFLSICRDGGPFANYQGTVLKAKVWTRADSWVMSFILRVIDPTMHVSPLPLNCEREELKRNAWNTGACFWQDNKDGIGYSILERDQKRWLGTQAWLVEDWSLIVWGSGWSKVWIVSSTLLSARAVEGVHCNNCCSQIRSHIHQNRVYRDSAGCGSSPD